MRSTRSKTERRSACCTERGSGSPLSAPAAPLSGSARSVCHRTWRRERGRRAIVRARASDIVLTEKISGVPVAVIETDHIRKVGTQAGPIARRMLQHPRLKHYMRMFYSLQSLWQLKRASLQGMSYRDYFQAGQSVEGIDAVVPAGEVVASFRAAVEEHHAGGVSRSAGYPGEKPVS